MRLTIAVSLCGLLLAAGAQHALGQTIDYDLNQATRSIQQIDDGLARLQPGDVANYNRLSATLAKAAEHLQATESTNHPDFQVAVQRWGELQQQMVAIAEQWQQAQAAAQQQAEAAARQQATAQQQAAGQPQATARQPAQQAPSAQQATQPAPTPVDLDPLLTKYQRSNLPALSETASAGEAREWAIYMRGLQTTTLQADLAQIAAAEASGAAAQSDVDRVRRWVSDIHQGAITEAIQQAIMITDGTIESVLYSADLITGIADGDMNGAYRVAGGDNLTNNIARLDNALRAGEVAEVLDEVFATSNATRAERIARVQTARNRLDALAPLGAQQAEVLANAPRRQPAARPDFLAPIAQEFWLNGSVMAESEEDGSIWIDSRDVGDITNDGEIWVRSRERGSIEPNGEVWFDSRQVGSLEPNGEVWRDSRQVGLIEQNGDVWVNGNAAGQIVPFQGEWKRAAILYYFGDYFAE